MKNRNELFVVIATASFLAFTLFTVLNMGTGCGKGKTSGSSPDSGSGKEMTSSSGGGALSPRERANQADCTSRLKQIGLAAAQYAISYDDFWPTCYQSNARSGGVWLGKSGSYRAFNIFVDSDILRDPKGFICPSADDKKYKPAKPSYYANLESNNVAYNWCDGLMGGNSTMSPVACDFTDNHKTSGRFVRGNGSVGTANGTKWTEDSSFKNFTRNYRE